MAQFRDYLEREGVETEGMLELPLFIWANEQFLNKGLVVPRVPDDRSFAAEAAILLAPDPYVRAHVDMSLKVEALESGRAGVTVAEAQSGRDQAIPEESLGLVDWERAYLDLLEYKERKGLANLVIPRDAPRRILAHRTEKGTRLYRLVADESVARPASFAGTALLQEAVTNILRKYADEFYRIKREQWDSRQMVFRALDAGDANLGFNRGVLQESKAGYVVRIRRSEKQLVSAVQKLIKNAEALYRQDARGLPRIYFDRHLYQPLLLEREDDVKSTPPGLRPSEADFVRDLKVYWTDEKDKSLAGLEVFLLRNLSRGSGIGFFEERGFYPDFILWIMDGQRQHIVFVEPHGMRQADAYANDPKARLHEELPGLAQEIGARCNRQDITMDSYVVSVTPYDDLRAKYGDGKWDRAKFASAHILFQERGPEYDYVQKLLQGQPAPRGL